jgi:galactoside O-acetyltransferase
MDDPASGASAPVIIEDDVFIGTQVMILKGTRIGKGSVVGAGSVVAGEIPPQVLVAGNPAQVLRQL